MNSDGSGLRDISQHGTGEWRQPDWSPDGSKIVHLRYIGVGTEEVFVMDTLGSNAERLTFNSVVDRDPKWSPDGAEIAWTQTEGLRVEIRLMDTNGSNQRRLATGFQPSWSPDSRQIVFSALRPTKDKASLWTINRDGTGLKQLTQ
jgi:Tol biopolymer transport system component